MTLNEDAERAAQLFADAMADAQNGLDDAGNIRALARYLAIAYSVNHSIGEGSGFYFRREDMPSLRGDVEVTVKIT